MTAAIAHPLTGREAATICADLARQDIPVLAAADIYGVVHIWPGRPTTVREEIAVLRPFILATDAPKAWHGVKA